MGAEAQQTDIGVASENFKSTRAYESLVELSKTIGQGMRRERVEALLGVPDHVPVDGQAVYASDKRVPLGENGLIGVEALVLGYNDKDRVTRDTVQSIYLGPIAE